MYTRFCKLDKDKSGSIDKNEFLTLAQFTNNPLSQRLIDVFDKDGSGDVDFKEFITGLSAFSVKGHGDDKLKCKEILSLI